MEDAVYSTVEFYFIEGNLIYVSADNEYRTLPNTPHNIEYCNQEIRKYLEGIDDFLAFRDTLSQDITTLAKARYILSYVSTFNGQRYLRNLSFLYHHLDELQNMWEVSTPELEEIKEENTAFGSLPNISNLLSYEPYQINEISKVLKKNLMPSTGGKNK